MAIITNPLANGEVPLERIAELEKYIGEQLPKDYRSFLTRTDGGFPDPDGWEDERFGGAIVSYFYSLTTGELLQAIEDYRNRIPSEIIPIAEDMGGSIICLGIKGERRGKVFYWEHELEASGSGATYYDNVYELTNSFQDFMSNLVSEYCAFQRN